MPKICRLYAFIARHGHGKTMAEGRRPVRMQNIVLHYGESDIDAGYEYFAIIKAE